MEKEPGCATEVDEEEAVYLFLEEQAELVQDAEGTQRSEEPAIKTQECFFPLEAKKIKQTERTIKVYQEVLAGSSDGNCACPLLIILLIGQRLRLALLNASRESGYRLDFRTLNGMHRMRTTINGK
jgi:hypothetical protein